MTELVLLALARVASSTPTPAGGLSRETGPTSGKLSAPDFEVSIGMCFRDSRLT